MSPMAGAAGDATADDHREATRRELRLKEANTKLSRTLQRTRDYLLHFVMSLILALLSATYVLGVVQRKARLLPASPLP